MSCFGAGVFYDSSWLSRGAKLSKHRMRLSMGVNSYRSAPEAGVRRCRADRAVGDLNSQFLSTSGVLQSVALKKIKKIRNLRPRPSMP